jgi:hypothetical protein
MFRVLTATLLAALILSSAAEARAGRGFGGFRKSSPAPQTKSVAPAAAANASPNRGSANVVVPVPILRREARPPASAAAVGAPLGLAAPSRPVSAAAPVGSEPAAAPRPWCESGKVVGGLCLLN